MGWALVLVLLLAWELALVLASVLALELEMESMQEEAGQLCSNNKRSSQCDCRCKSSLKK